MRGAAIVVAIALLAGCADRTVPPAGVAGNALTDARESWMLPEATSENLLYVDESKGRIIDVFTFQGGKLVGEIKQTSAAELQQGMCADAKGDVFVNDMIGNYGHTFEYAHGGTTPIADLQEYGVWVWGCSVDPTSGNLAVASVNWLSAPSWVAVYANATGTPQIYEDPNIINYEFCGYDASGNLFVDGTGAGGRFVFAELPKGSSTFADIAIRQYIEYGGQVQWDGHHIVVGTANTAPLVVLHLKIKGDTARAIRYTRPAASQAVPQFWISGHVIVGPEGTTNRVGLWTYPNGKLIRRIRGVKDPFGAAVSLVSTR